MFIKKNYENHPEIQWKKVSQILNYAIEKEPQFVKINASHALIRWLHPTHIENITSKIKIEKDPHVKGNLIFALIKLIIDGKLDKTIIKVNKFDLSNATLRDINFKEHNLSNIKFQFAYLHGSNFERAVLTDTDFQKANLLGANFRYANLSRANLEGSNLQDADFEGANLKNANLKNSKSKGINNFLKITNLKSTQFSEACDLTIEERNFAKDSAAIFVSNIKT